ncbi:MAG: hypothetical protein ACP5NE_01550 [Candidatus Micrarchaeia archaeon]
MVFPSIMLSPTFSSVHSLLFPLVLLAFFIDAMLLSIWYFLGVLLNNRTVKSSALSEFYQLIGTALLIAVVLGVLVFAGELIYSTMSSTALLNPFTVSNMLNNVMTTTQLSIIGPSDSLLVPANTAYFPGVFLIVYDAEYTNSFTTKIDYPLAASVAVLANLTNQTAGNINNMFNLDAFLGFLDTLTPQTGFCISKGLPCYVPNIGAITDFWISVGFTPYAGYDMIYTSMKALTLVLTSSLEAFVAQLLFFVTILYAWPFLLFLGIIFRATFFTRKVGGLLIAIAVSSVLIFPTIFALEYLSLANGVPAYAPSTYGFNSITPLPAAPSGTTKYEINFFVEPNIASIAIHNGCYPEIGGYTTLLGSEFADIAQTMIPFANIVLLLYGKFVSPNQINFPLLVGCGLPNALKTLFDMLNVYGIIGVVGYFLPIVNLLIFISSIRGLSGLMGGDTTLGGLSRLI